mmetsp:Transcript_2554/g.5571  ORF Transcript_2554/g.5571 Transcript_2554/m.5571 type:complete len:282 (-) Transcript_2554:551-1396(-)
MKVKSMIIAIIKMHPHRPSNFRGRNNFGQTLGEFSTKPSILVAPPVRDACVLCEDGSVVGHFTILNECPSSIMLIQFPQICVSPRRGSLIQNRHSLRWYPRIPIGPLLGLFVAIQSCFVVTAIMTLLRRLVRHIILLLFSTILINGRQCLALLPSLLTTLGSGVLLPLLLGRLSLLLLLRRRLLLLLLFLILRTPQRFQIHLDILPTTPPPPFQLGMRFHIRQFDVAFSPPQYVFDIHSGNDRVGSLIAMDLSNDRVSARLIDPGPRAGFDIYLETDGEGG